MSAATEITSPPAAHRAETSASYPNEKEAQLEGSEGSREGEGTYEDHDVFVIPFPSTYKFFSDYYRHPHRSRPFPVSPDYVEETHQLTVRLVAFGFSISAFLPLNVAVERYLWDAHLVLLVS